MSLILILFNILPGYRFSEGDDWIRRLDGNFTVNLLQIDNALLQMNFATSVQNDISCILDIDIH
jgi:hypothetical protein